MKPHALGFSHVEITPRFFALRGVLVANPLCRVVVTLCPTILEVDLGPPVHCQDWEEGRGNQQHGRFLFSCPSNQANKKMPPSKKVTPML